MKNKEIEISIAYLKQLDSVGVKGFSVERFGKIVDMLGAANYKADTQLVAATNPDEVQRLSTVSFMTEVLGVKDPKVAAALVKKALVKMKDVKRKYRAVTYYFIGEAHRAMKK